MFRRSYSTALNSVKALKVSATPTQGYLSNLTVKINAGSRYSSKDGISHILSRFAFQDNAGKSALRFAREAEVLGGVYSSKVTRDSIILSANFQKEDLPYFVNGIADVLSSTNFKIHEFKEIVLPTVKYDFTSASKNVEFHAVEALHNLIFRNGLGKPLLYDGVTKITDEDVATFASKAFTQSNIEVFGSGIEESDLTKFIGESSFEKLSVGEKLTDSISIHNGESRIRSSNGNAAAIGTAIKPEEFGSYETVATFINQTTSLKASVLKYSDAGVFTVVSSGSSASNVASSIKSITTSLKAGVDASEFFALTKAQLAIENDASGSIATDVKVDSVSKLSLGKFSYVAIGDTTVLPFADEL